MPYPTFVPGEQLSATALNSMVAATTAAQRRADAAYALIPGSGNTPGGVALDSFAGSTDDAKLTAALSYAAAQTIKPHIFFSNRLYTFTQANRVVYSGMKLSGLGGHGDQQRGARSIPNDIRFQGSGTWFVCPSGSTFDVYVGGLCLQGNRNAQFMSANPGVLWTSVFRDMGFNLWKHVFGNPAASMLITAVLMDGWWNVNNSYNTAFTFGGSDSNLFTDGCLLDSPTSIIAASPYHFEAQWLEKTHVGPMYITVKPPGIRVTGSSSNSEGALVFSGQGRCEGRNTRSPCAGSNIRIDGGGVTIRDWAINYGASALNTNGHSGEGGLITITNGQVLLDGLWYDRATGVAETMPFVYQTGGYARVKNIMVAKPGQWTKRPRFRTVGGSYSTDDSVTLVTL